MSFVIPHFILRFLHLSLKISPKLLLLTRSVFSSQFSVPLHPEPLVCFVLLATKNSEDKVSYFLRPVTSSSSLMNTKLPVLLINERTTEGKRIKGFNPESQNVPSQFDSVVRVSAHGLKGLGCDSCLGYLQEAIS